MTIQNPSQEFKTITEAFKPFVLSSQCNVGEKMVSAYLHIRPHFDFSSVFKNHYIAIALAPARGKHFSNEARSQDLDYQIGDLTIYPANTSGKWQIETEHKYLSLSIAPEVIRQAIVEVTDGSYFELLPKLCFADPLIQHLIIQITEGMQSLGTIDQLYTDSLLNTLAIHLMKNYATRRQKIPVCDNGLSKHHLCRAIDYIQTHLEKNIKLADMAGQLGMSQYYFCRLFRQSTGVSPYQYLIQQRIERAKGLLQQPQKRSIAEIALECGFTNQSGLCRHFRNLTGITPTAYRKQL